MSTVEDRWHRVLLRQMRRAGLDLDALPQEPALTGLLDRISATYAEADQERYLNDRAFALSSGEMLELNERLRRAQATELAVERDRLQAVFDAVAIGLVVVATDGRVIDLNPSAEALLGSTSRSTVGLDLGEVLGPAPDDAASQSAFDALVSSARTGHAWRGADVHLATPIRRGFPANLAFAPLFDDLGPAGGVLAITDTTERAEAQAELAWRASHDALTGLLNRTALHELLHWSLDRRRVGGARVAVLFIDLDRFKLVNDTLGHAAGDALLVAAVTRIIAATRAHDTVARLGGDEFVILTEHIADPQEAMQLADRIVRALATPFTLDSELAFVSASVGVAVSDASSTAASLLRDADVALYRAKDAGRSRAVLFHQSMHDDVADRVRLERHLRHALDDNELSVAFQPIYTALDRRLAGFETLVRWDGPDGWVDPGLFVRLAEDTGLVGLMGDWVLESATDFMTLLSRRGLAHIALSVNLSSIQLGDPMLPARVAELVSRMGAPPRQLMLEITETALLAEPDLTRERLHELRACGVRVALDDFGTGYSSLSALRDFPLDALKIDKSFVGGMIDSGRDRAIVAAIISLGHALGMTIIAEGIETIEQCDAVTALGCDRLQGFLLGHPLTPADAEALVADALGGRP
jgi:diguanylate cyclase (GGDEF)-like protein/PAS domain S-box-containing protein